MTPSVARGTLEAARFYVSQADRSLPDDITAFRYHLEAAIVFARSVTFHIQKEFAGAPGFDAWYEPHRKTLADDSLARYFLEKRNYLLKQGRVQLNHRLSVIVGAHLTMAGSVSVKVIRGNPWYRRSLRILWEDAVRPLRERISRVRQAFAEGRRERERQTLLAQDATQYGTRFVGFVDAPVADRPATELLRRYLDQLDSIVTEAERHFKTQERAV